MKSKYSHSEEISTHRLSKHPLYAVWQHIIQRCHNPNCKFYHNYGGRGIYVCNEWRTHETRNNRIIRSRGNPEFLNFYNWAMTNGYERGLSLDRIDNDGPYSPDNCRWASHDIQQNNKRTNALIEDLDGSISTISIFARKHGFDANYVFHRISRGWSMAAIMYAIYYPEKDIHKSPSVGYMDKDGFQVLIPTLNKQKIDFQQGGNQNVRSISHNPGRQGT